MSERTLAAHRLAAFSTEFELDHAPADVIERIEHAIADTLACAIGASFEIDSPAIGSVYQHSLRFESIPDATIIGTDRRVERRAAALVNSTLARHLDANDIYMGNPGRFAGSGHFSDALPAILSVAESVRSSGAELLEAAIIAYEIQGVLADSYLWMDQGLHTVSQVTIAVAAATSRLFKLPVEQAVHAIALAMSSGMILQSWLKPSVQVPTIKSSAAGIAAERGVMCAELASAGATGPTDAFETMTAQWPAEFQPQVFDRLAHEWSTLRNAIKSAPAQIFTQPVIQCAEQLFEQGLRLESMQTLLVRSNNGACGRVQGSAGAFRPETREAADHSTPYVVAMTLLDGSLSLKSYEDSQWNDPVVREAMTRMTLVIDPDWDARFAAGQFGAEIEAYASDGSRYSAIVEQFAGHPDNPLSDEQLIEKMRGLMEGNGRLPDGRARGLFDACTELRYASTVQPLIVACTQTVQDLM